MNRTLKALVVCLPLAIAAPLHVAYAADAAANGPTASPRLRVVVQVDEKDPAVWMLALNNVRNAQKDVGPQNIDVEVVAFGPGLEMLKDDSVVANRVQDAIGRGVHFVACRNTMRAEHVTEAELIPGIGYTQAGVVEIIRKQTEGYTYLRP
jgi:intracellular sulfur oxidation DsrE/DsrF family protein